MAMSRDKLIIIGAVVLGLLGVLVYRQMKQDESLGAAPAIAVQFPSVNAPDDIDKISVTNGEKPEIVLERVPDPKGTATDAGPATQWVLTKPLHAEAGQQAVKDLVANLKDIKVESQVNLRLDDEVRKEKQLDSAHALHLIAWKDGDKKVDEFFGKSGAAGQLVVVADKPDVVWAAKGYSSYLYAKEPKDFRDKEILHFDDASIGSVTLVNSHGTLAFTKVDGKWTGLLGKKPIERLDQEKVKDMLRAYKSLSADDFGDGKSLAETGLDKPDAQATFQAKGDEPQTYGIWLGKVSNGTDRWAKRAEDDAVFQITSYAADWLTADTAKYQAPLDGGAGDGGGPKKTKSDAGKK
jgi:hypothetical protein